MGRRPPGTEGQQPSRHEEAQDGELRDRRCSACRGGMVNEEKTATPRLCGGAVSRTMNENLM